MNTPMTDPANAPLVLLCHDEARKQVSTVYQFQSMETGGQSAVKRGWGGDQVYGRFM